MNARKPTARAYLTLGEFIYFSVIIMPYLLNLLLIKSNMSKPKTRWLFAETNLLNVRVVFLSAAFLHLVVTAVVTLSIDTTVDEDPRVRSYYHVRWKLLTCWFNLLTLVYLPIRIYVDWKTKRSEGNQRLVKSLNHATDVLMTAVLMPTTVFSDVMFWSLYLIDPGLLAPVVVFEYLPYWSQHSLHSVSLIVVLLDFLLTPRRRPSSIKLRLILMLGFVLVYSAMVYHSLCRREIVYAFLEHMSLIQLALVLLCSLALHFILFKIQFFVIDLLWKRKVKIECVTIKLK